MQVIAAPSSTARADRLAVARSTLAAVLMIVVGVILAWACIATPIVSSFVPAGRPSPVQMAVGIFAWGFAIVAPAGFLIIGVARIVGTLEGLAVLRKTAALSPRIARALGPDHAAAMNLVLPGGRRVHELVLGPFGIVVLGAVPPPDVSRHVAGRWEVRGPRGRWIPIESPVDRATRDAERVRGWLATDDRDFVVKVYAAIVTDDTRVTRTPACAVVRTAELAGWLEALPPQRGLTPGRRERLVEIVRSVTVRR